jgi:3-oxoacyl-[acyl-carrier-protein] synthase-3
MKQNVNNIGFKIISTGVFLSENVFSNFDLEKILDTSDEWITQRTGIKQRSIATKEETSTYMASIASKKAIEKIQLDVNEIDLIITATTTNSLNFPSISSAVAKFLNITKKEIACFDVSAACAGFLYAFITANQYINSGKYKKILVIGSDKNSDILDWKDRNTAVLFGDGAGAVLLEAVENKNSLLDFNFYNDINQFENLCTKSNTFNYGFNSKNDQNSNGILMDGQEIFKNAVKNLSDSILKILLDNKLTAKEIKYIIPHQANMRIIEAVSKRTEILIDKFVSNLSKTANTSAASIPIAIDSIFENFKTGDKIILTAIGAGLTWGSCLIEI